MPGKQVNMNHFGAHLRKTLDKAPRVIGVMALNHFKESFKMQQFNNPGSPRWEPTKSGKSSGILIGKQSGALRNSGQVLQADLKLIRVGFLRPYANTQNQGGVVHPRVTPQMRKFAWAKHYSARTNDEKEKWKGLALTKKTRLTIKIPKRQFVGPSRSLNVKVNAWLSSNLDYRG